MVKLVHYENENYSHLHRKVKDNRAEPTGLPSFCYYAENT